MLKNKKITKTCVGASIARPCYKGITLISLVITIIIILILAGVGISGSLSLIEKAEATAALNELQQINETMAIYILEKELEATETGEKIVLFDEESQVKSTSELYESLQNEIKYVRAMLSGTDISELIPDYLKNYTLEITEEGSRIYYISDELSGGKHKAYIYDEKSASVYKIEPVRIYGVAVHGHDYGNLLVSQPGILQKAQGNKQEEIAEGEFVIIDVKTMQEFRDKVNEGKTFEGETVHLKTNINLSSIENWEPIGNSTNPFKGTFKGNNNTISNLRINNETGNYQGLFGYTDGAKIYDINIEDANITGNNYVGGIVGYLKNGEITNCITITTTTSKITGAKYVGGISGWLEKSTATNCGNKIEITGTTYIGGIIGHTVDADITSTYNKGNVTAEVQSAGGIVGHLWCDESGNGSTVLYSYNTGNITGFDITGGIVGCAGDYAKVQNSYNLGNIKVTGYGTDNDGIKFSYVGGIVGYNRRCCNTDYCYNLGMIINAGSGNYTGGIVGSNNSYNISTGGSIVQYSYNSVNVISNGTQIGGIVGYNQRYCYVKDSYILDTVKVIKGTETSTTATATANTGSSSNYLGKIVGYPYSTSTTYISNVGTLEEDEMPTVYNVVNGLSDEDSEYWSKSDLNAPKLKWEESN